MKIISVKVNLTYFPCILITIHGDLDRYTGIIIIIYGNLLGTNQIFLISI